MLLIAVLMKTILTNSFLPTLQTLYMMQQKNPILFSQKHLNDLIIDLCLSTKKAELLASRFKEGNMLEKDIKASYNRKRNRDFSSELKVEGPLCYCHDIKELF